jgi:hypothetical protein
LQFAPCVDGSELARAFFTLQRWSVQPCVRPVSVVHMTAAWAYSTVPALVQYILYDPPDPAYVTGRIDISARLGAISVFRCECAQQSACCTVGGLFR